MKRLIFASILLIIFSILPNAEAYPEILREHLKNQEKQLFTSFKTVELWKEYFEKSKERYESEIKIRDEEIKRSHQEIDGLKKTINKLEAENNSLKGHNTTGIYN
ncbi:725_t:CDS:2 [Entrophospora sp. SA101]|nr:725_t:CDS:2 [Entrophospora sp. SA101]